MYGEPEPDPSEQDTRVRTRPMRDRDAPTSVAERVDELDKLLHTVGEQIERAADRLGPILRPERPVPALAVGGSTDDVSSELSARLSRIAGHADHLGRNLRELLDRVDL